jgi:DNA-binding response OmpR family regulator
MRILVVEDEAGVARFIRQGLSEAGYAVDVAQDGQ